MPGEGFLFIFECEYPENPLLDAHLEISSNLKRAWLVYRMKMSSILFNDFYKKVFYSTTYFSLVLFFISISSLLIRLYCWVKNWFKELSLLSSLIVLGSSWIIILLISGRIYFIICTGCSLIIVTGCYFIGECLKITLSWGFPSIKMHFLFNPVVFVWLVI